MHRFAPGQIPETSGSQGQRHLAMTKTLEQISKPKRSRGHCHAHFPPSLTRHRNSAGRRPAHIACPRRKEICGEILWAAGPWRTSGDWWEQEGWARDEWDIALQETGGITLYRLVRDLLSGQWLLEGNYD